MPSRCQALGLVLTLFGALLGFSAQAHAPKVIEAVPGEYIVKLKTSVMDTNHSFKALAARLGATVKSTMPEAGLIVVKKAAIQTQSSAIESLSDPSMVEYVEPNYIYHVNKTPNDPMFGQLWGMHNAKSPGVDIDALRAWDIETGNPDLIVAVVDTGVNYTHPDLQDNIWTNTAELNGQPGIDDDNNGVIDDIHGYNATNDTGDPMDDHGHGSHCSGTIGATGNDGHGIVGVNWHVKIMASKFLDSGGSGTLESAIKAIDYATKMGAKVMSNSWGGGGFSQALLESIRRATDAGVVFIAAAGNDGTDNDASPGYPASYDEPSIISVAAVDSACKKADFSNYGKRSVHVAAPGVAIVSSVLNTGYDTYSGTSMATPHVSGVAALLLAHEPNLTNLEVKARLIKTAAPLPSLRNRVASAGMVNAYYALTNQVAPPNENDPINWSTVDVNISSPHPYENNYEQTYTVHVPGAKKMALYFSKFETEGHYDVLKIVDAQGNTVDKISGSASDTFSAVIEGDTATLNFKSDSSNTAYGFDIVKAAVQN